MRAPLLRATAAAMTVRVSRVVRCAALRTERNMCGDLPVRVRCETACGRAKPRTGEEEPAAPWGGSGRHGKEATGA
ncbi:hypothetical protein SY2F82_16220 [Streptomyces sp. Y2F8-2]|nr:hypothetical protein SY2F82_16220 [Streptomyces sp. Y2F8-2]